jgi:hypothetical protein
MAAGDCRQQMTGLRQRAAAAEAVRGRCVWWEVRWEVRWEVQWEVWWKVRLEVGWEVRWLVVFDKSFWCDLAVVTPATDNILQHICLY